VEKAPAFIPALFRLAFLVDLNGDEGRAKELYKQCVQHEPAHVNALLNLSVLCDDSGEYEQAIAYLKRILHVHPNHGRARLFLKDAMSSSDMYYDEEYEKRRDKFQQVLEMPISDFELSVRSRNCLKKMGIRTLGDLTRITEAELLSYKNFGETSLNEIKAIMSSKNLRLGQALEDQASRKAASILPGVGAEDDQPRPDQSLMAKSIDELNLSVRSRKCLQRLDVQTIGDLTNYTEAQLMAVKNFGTISLKEIKDRLAEMNLSLRVPEV
jgi:DNA-directed RNA polymerase subunit alpha